MRKININNIFVIFIIISLIVTALCLLMSLAKIFDYNLAIVFATILTGIATVGVILWQGSLIKKQIQFQIYMDLEKEWNSDNMIVAREALVTSTEPIPAHVLEAVLEFFEKFALFAKRDAMDMDFILSSSIGFYAVRYYFYFRKDIVKLRNYYDEDAMYCELQSFYRRYLKFDGSKSLDETLAYEERLAKTRTRFMENESNN